MKIYIMTDMEGVAGILNAADWIYHESRYYELGREFLTREVNAAIDGFCAAGASEILISDGHGPGAIRPELLDSRAELLRGWPCMLDKSFDAVAFVGQHAKAGTEYSHITHTQGFNWIDLTVNGVSIGEFGQLAMCASELGVRTIFAAGELALCKEAETLILGIGAAAVKRGITPGIGDELTAEQYKNFHLAAIHKTPEAAQKLIRSEAEKTLKMLPANIKKNKNFGLIKLTPPFERAIQFRENGEWHPRSFSKDTHSDSVIGLMNLPIIKIPYEPLRKKYKDELGRAT